MRLLAPLLVLLPLGLLGGCIHRYYDAELGTVKQAASTDTMDAALRVHLDGGEVALFRDGARVGPDGVRGDGVRYDLARRDSSRVSHVPADSIALIQFYRRDLDVGRTVLVSGAASIAYAGVVIGLFLVSLSSVRLTP